MVLLGLRVVFFFFRIFLDSLNKVNTKEKSILHCENTKAAADTDAHQVMNFKTLNRSAIMLLNTH